MNYWYGDNPNCGRCGHLNGHGHCNMTACIYPVIETTTIVTPEIKPRTNYDLIICKTPEELAKELVVLSDRCPDGVDCESVPHGRECFECWLDWLRQEVTE